MAKTSCKCKQVRGQKNRNALPRTDAASCKCNEATRQRVKLVARNVRLVIHTGIHPAFTRLITMHSQYSPLCCAAYSQVFFSFFGFLFICFYSPHTTVHTVTTIRQVSHFVYIFSLLVSQYEFQFWFLSHTARHMQLCNRSKRVCSTN